MENEFNFKKFPHNNIEIQGSISKFFSTTRATNYHDFKISEYSMSCSYSRDFCTVDLLQHATCPPTEINRISLASFAPDFNSSNTISESQSIIANFASPSSISLTRISSYIHCNDPLAIKLFEVILFIFECYIDCFSFCFLSDTSFEILLCLVGWKILSV